MCLNVNTKKLNSIEKKDFLLSLEESKKNNVFSNTIQHIVDLHENLYCCFDLFP